MMASAQPGSRQTTQPFVVRVPFGRRTGLINLSEGASPHEPSGRRRKIINAHDLQRFINLKLC